MKALLAVLTAALLLLTGCSPTQTYELRDDLSIYFVNADEVILNIRRALRERWKRIYVEYRAHGDNMDDIQTLASELMEYALDETGDPAEGDYLRHQYGGYDLNYGYTSDSGGYEYFLEFTPVYYTTSKQEKTVDEAVREAVKDISGSEYQRVRAVYEYLKENVTYDKAAAKSGTNTLKATAYAALIQHRAVCQGYAVTAYRLLRECGIAARVVTGTVTLEDGSEEYHAWNLVGIDGRFYELDVTWDAQRGDESCFLKSADDIPDRKKDEKYLTDGFKEKYPPAEESYEI